MSFDYERLEFPFSAEFPGDITPGENTQLKAGLPAPTKGGFASLKANPNLFKGQYYTPDEVEVVLQPPSHMTRSGHLTQSLSELSDSESTR